MLHRRLAQEFLTAGEGAEELVVEIVAVGEYHHGRVFHRRLADDPSSIEGHGQTLARALGVPDHPDAAVARGAARSGARPRASRSRFSQIQRPDGLGNPYSDRMELVVAR